MNDIREFTFLIEKIKMKSGNKRFDGSEQLWFVVGWVFAMTA